MDNKKQLALNLSAGIISFIVNLGIKFFLSPYIIESVGIEAYGFVALANNFITYASLVTIALNSMAGRFITIEIHRENIKDANKYFSSVIIANIIIAGTMLIPSALCVIYIDKIVNIPKDILTDVRILFALLFTNFLIRIVTSAFSVATFVKNKLYLKSLRKIEANIIRAIVLVTLFVFLKPAVSYLGVAALTVLLYGTFFNLHYTKQFLPQLKIKRKYFDVKAVKELIASGIWNTIIRAGQLLLEGVDLLITNLFISATVMGSLALAKTIPSLITTVVGLIAGVFLPDFTRLYARNKTNELLMSLKRSMKLLGILINVPIALLISFGDIFFKLWVPNQDAHFIHILAIMTVFTFVVSAPINSIYGIFTVTNKLKLNSMLVVFTGILNIIIVLILLKTTDLGIYAVVGVSTLLSITRNLVFTAPFGAKYLGLKWHTFLPAIIKSVISFIIVTLIGVGIHVSFVLTSWVSLMIASGVTATLGMTVNLYVILERSERAYLIKVVKRKTGFK